MSKMLFRVVIGLLALLSSLAWGSAQITVRYVKQGASGDGSSWAKASGDLQEMIDQSQAGDQVWIASGVYKPTQLLDAKRFRSFAFRLKEGVSLYGGFQGTETTLKERARTNNDDTYAPVEYLMLHETIIDGNVDGNQEQWIRKMDDGSKVRYSFQITGNEQNANHLLFLEEVAQKPMTIDGLTLCNAYADVFQVYAGGAALYARGAVTLSHCRIHHNAAKNKGDGISFYGGAVTLLNGKGAEVSHCLFSHNFAFDPGNVASGGSLYIENGTVRNCRFEHSVSLDEGGALTLKNSNAVQCGFLHCYAARGGSIYSIGGNNTIEQSMCFFSRGLVGGAIYTDGGSIHQTIIANCYADDPAFGDAGGGQGGGIYALKETKVVGTQVTNCEAYVGGGIFLRNNSELYHSTVQNCSTRKLGSSSNVEAEKDSKIGNSIVEDQVDLSNFEQPTSHKGFKSVEADATLTDDLYDRLVGSWRLAQESEFIGTGELIEGIGEYIDYYGILRMHGGKMDRGAFAFQKKGECLIPALVFELDKDSQKTISIEAVLDQETPLWVDWGDGIAQLYTADVDKKVILQGTPKGRAVSIGGSDSMPRFSFLNLSGKGMSRIQLQPDVLCGELECNNNLLTDIDLSNQPALEGASVRGNRLQRIQVAPQTDLQYLNVSDNQMSANELNLLFYRLPDVRATLASPLLGDRAKQLVAGNNPGWEKSASEEAQYKGWNVVAEDAVQEIGLKSLAFFYDSSIDEVLFPELMYKVFVYNVLGEKMLEVDAVEVLSLSSLLKGSYVLVAITADGKRVSGTLLK